jgi:hypothetical protein
MGNGVWSADDWSASFVLLHVTTHLLYNVITADGRSRGCSAQMAFIDLIWDLDDDDEGNVAHIAEHDLTKDDVLWVLNNPVSRGTSRSSGRPLAYGYTQDDVYIAVVYEEVDEGRVYPVTAYPVEE